MRLFLLGYFFLLPFQWALSPVEGVDLAFIRVASLLAVLLFLSLSLLRKRLFLSTGAAVVFLLGFLGVAALSLFWAENSAFAFRKVLFLFSFAPLFFIFCARFEEFPVERLALLRAYVWGACLVGISGIILFLSQFIFGVSRIFSFLTEDLLPFFLGTSFAQAVAAYPSLLVNVSGLTLLRASGPFPDPHMFSYYVGMAAPLALMLFFREPAKRYWLVMALVLILADLLSFSRGGYIGLVLSAFVFAFGFVSFRSLSIRQTLLVGGVALMLGVAVVSTPLGSRLTSIFSSEDGSNTERLRLWQEAVVHVGERPLFGVGLGNYPLLVKPGAGYREPIYAHNLFLDIALELGLLGLLLFLGLLGSVLLSLGRIFLRTREPEGLFLLASLVVFIGHSFFETPLFSVHVLPALLLVLALGVSYKK